jgi:pimeloyl-ACP methyl ester carboxylesterase
MVRTGSALRPLILIRGFGGPDVTSEQRSPYQGYNDGTVYPGKRGENYIYEGFLLRALKSDQYRYEDATNVVGYYADGVEAPDDLDEWQMGLVSGTVVIDPPTARRVLQRGTAGSIWVYRYYDLTPRALARYGEGLMTLIGLIEAAAERHDETFEGVDIVAHSMGGLVLREALRQFDQSARGSAQKMIHRVVTLGTPHRGIAFQRIPGWVLERLPGVERAANELAAFDPTRTDFLDIVRSFPVTRILTVVGTNYRTYGNSAASLMNRLSSLLDEGSLGQNRSDGLVKQASAQLPGAPRTFVHKCHGGPDSLVTSREAYEIAMRFFHGSHKVRLWLDRADVRRGQDWFGRSEFYFGVSIKPRYVDFDLFHQSPEAENCYGPFAKTDLSDGLPDLAAELSKPLANSGDRSTGWAGPDRLIWEGWVDAGAKPDAAAPGLVFRLDVYVGERDSRGIGFSDNVIFRKQYYVQAFPGDSLALFVHTGEKYLSAKEPKTRDELDVLAEEDPDAPVQRPRPTKAARERRLRWPRNDRRSAVGGSGGGGEWTFDVRGTGFEGTFRLAVEADDRTS